ncbi:MAG: HIT family protein [Anaerolineales bacterium]|nr:HIT family protein [Anaerolineales bacterium]
MKNCFLCQKHKGQVAPPPGGYIYEGEHWLVCHAPVDKGPLGTLFIESRRHFLDFAEANEEELASYGPLLKKVYAALKSPTGAERVYQVVFVDGIPHFHTWLVPRRKGDEKGVPFLAKGIVCELGEAEELAGKLREILGNVDDATDATANYEERKLFG